MNRPFILMHDYGGYAFPLQLSMELAKRDYRILHVYTSSSGSPTADFPPDTPNLQCIDIDIPRVRKAKFMQRWQAENLYGKKAAAIIRQHAPDVVISANTPLSAQAELARVCQQINCHFIFWLQDILSLAVRSVLTKRLGFIGQIIGWYYQNIEKRLLRNAYKVITIADAFAAILKDWGIELEKVSVIPNWAPIEHIAEKAKINPFALEYGLEEKFVVLYSGTMGMKQNPEIVVTAAKALRAFDDIIFVVISDGVGMDYLATKKKTLNLDNLLLLPLQPFARLPDILATADVGLVLLNSDAGTFCVPSKLWSIYCSARAALLVIPEQNVAARLTKEIAAGVVLTPDESDKLSQVILSLKSQPEKRLFYAKNGRQYAEQNFRIERIADRFERVFQMTNSYAGEKYAA